MRPDGTRNVVITDHLGSTRLTLSTDAAPMQSQLHNAFGEVTSDVGEGARTGYIGREHDVESDLGFYGVRLYEPEYGRFMSTDPLWGMYLTMQPYQYASLVPTIKSDRSGLTEYFDKKSGAFLGSINDGRVQLAKINHDTWNEVGNSHLESLTGDGVRDAHALGAQMIKHADVIDMEGDEGLIIRTVYAEARGESQSAQEAVANVIENRVAAGITGKTVREVVTAKAQFSAVSAPNDPNQQAWLNTLSHASNSTLNMDALRRIVTAVHSALAPNSDNTNGATHYYSPKSMTSGRVPAFAKKYTPVIVPGVASTDFRFYKVK